MEVNDFKLYDRIIAHGIIIHWLEGEHRVRIDIEGQTGIIVTNDEEGRDYLGICFDNLFTGYLNSLNNLLKFNRGYTLYFSKVEKVKQTNLLKFLSFSPAVESVLEYCEFLNCPFSSDINYIDITDKNDTISYIREDRLNRLKSDETPWSSTLRQTMKIGKFIKHLNPNTNDTSLEHKVDLYKSAYDSIILKNSEFIVVQKQDVLKWYNESTYQYGAGSLNKSCMRNKPDKLYLYKNNPNKVSLLILINKEKKLIGRALIWNVDDPNIIYMDRPYTVYSSDEKKFINLANENGWSYYNINKTKPMKIFLNYNPGEPEDNPYMDTFRFFIIRGQHGKYYLTNTYEEDSSFEEYTDV